MAREIKLSIKISNQLSAALDEAAGSLNCNSDTLLATLCQLGLGRVDPGCVFIGDCLLRERLASTLSKGIMVRVAREAECQECVE